MALPTPPGRRSQTAGNSLTAIPACPTRCPDVHGWPRGHSGDIRRQSPGVGADAHLWFVGAGMAYRNFSATRQGWSKGIGGCDVSMKLCSSSSRCESCPAKGEPAQAGSKPCAGLGVPGVSERICAAAHIRSYAESINMQRSHH